MSREPKARAETLFVGASMASFMAYLGFSEGIRNFVVFLANTARELLSRVG